VDCCCATKSALNFCRSNCLLSALISKLHDSSDVLSQVVAIETLSRLTASYHGYEWIRDEGVLSYLMRLLRETSQVNPFVGLIQPGK
jgi:hypothetical protein